MGMVLEGGGTNRLAGQTEQLRAGASYYIPPGVPHEFETNPTGTTRIIDVEVVSGDSPSLDSELARALLDSWTYVRSRPVEPERERPTSGEAPTIGPARKAPA